MKRSRHPDPTAASRRRASPWTRPARAAMGLLRLSCYALFVTLAAAALTARVVHGRIEGPLVRMGDELVRLTESAGPGEHYLIRVNGRRIQVASAATSLPVPAVLDHFRRSCTERADATAGELADLRRALQALEAGAAVRGGGVPGVGVVHVEQPDRGMVFCFAPTEPTSPKTLTQRLEALVATGDVGSLGGARYVMVKRSIQGGSFVVGAWLDGALPLGEMFPATGDAPGSDVTDAHRPERSRRLLTGCAEGTPYCIRVYEVAGGERVLDGYDREMPRLGWDATPIVGGARPSTRAFSKGGVDLLVSAEPTAGGALLSVVEMRGR